MIVYRIGKSKFAADLTGEGARLHGGRWNHKLTPCVYTSESRALALLEYTVNINIDDIPRALTISTIEIPDKGIARPAIAELPGNWKDTPAPADTRDFGTQLLKTGHYPVIRVPSIVLPGEYNYLLNPLHPQSAGFRLLETKDFVYDVRIKLR